jgi:hypothetical protein
MKLVTNAPHVIPDVLTKWHIQLLHILAVLNFLALQSFNFSQLFLHEKTSHFGMTPPLSVVNLQKLINIEKVLKFHVIKI